MGLATHGGMDGDLRAWARGSILASALMALGAPASAQVATGTYDGNGGAGRSITVGFRPIFVFIKVDYENVADNDLSSGVIRTTMMTGDSTNMCVTTIRPFLRGCNFLTRRRHASHVSQDFHRFSTGETFPRKRAGGERTPAPPPLSTFSADLPTFPRFRVQVIVHFLVLHQWRFSCCRL